MCSLLMLLLPLLNCLMEAVRFFLCLYASREKCITTRHMYGIVYVWYLAQSNLLYVCVSYSIALSLFLSFSIEKWDFFLVFLFTRQNIKEYGAQTVPNAKIPTVHSSWLRLDYNRNISKSRKLLINPEILHYSTFFYST